MRAISGAVVVLLAAALLPLAGQVRGGASGPPAEQRTAVSPDDQVDLNHATLEQLLKVPGMTRSWAQRIIRYRPYRSKLDLVEEGILPGEAYSRIRDYVIAHREKD